MAGRASYVATTFTLTPALVAQIATTAAAHGFNRSAYIRWLVECDSLETGCIPLKVGMAVVHKKYGAGKVIGEWSPLRVVSSGIHICTPCSGIYDVQFGVEPDQFLRSCRSEFLQVAQ
jgi:hypothetical protein